MSIRTNIVRFDICGCVVEFIWDDSVPAEKRVETGTKVVVCCEAHKDLLPGDSDPAAHRNALVAECRTKNIVVNTLLENAPAELKDVVTVTEAGEDVYRFKKPVTWMFDADRKLTVTHPDFTEQDKIALTAKIEEVLPDGDVTLA